MSNHVTFTDKWVTSLKSSDSERWYTDVKVQGLSLRVRGDSKVYFLRWRDANGRRRKMSLKRVGQVKVANVREYAIELLSDIMRGIDPLQEKKFKRETPTLEELGNDVLDHLTSINKSASYMRDNKRIFNKRVIPTLGTLPVTDITLHDIERVLRGLRQMAREHNKTISLLSRIFKLGRKWGHVLTDPTYGLEKMKETVRDRVISDAEMDALLKVIETDLLNKRSANVIKVIALTGCRPAEAYQAQWEDFDLEAGYWNKPANTVKTRNNHKVELGDAALKILRTMNPLNETKGWVFPSLLSKTGHITTVRKVWDKWRKAAGCPDVRIYDLRRTLLTHLVAAGVDLKTVQSISNHSTPTILLKHYAHTVEGTQRAALNKVQKPPNKLRLVGE